MVKEAEDESSQEKLIDDLVQHHTVTMTKVGVVQFITNFSTA